MKSFSTIKILKLPAFKYQQIHAVLVSIVSGDYQNGNGCT
ncbi:MAG: hypothetical protein JWR61_2801 [Ferruginibacter sp.]|nr:hypothetical protein [Ferruginibacter sp.]